MRYFRLVHAGLDTSAILAELAVASDLWDANKDRTVRPGSPHAQSSDIWLRWYPRETLHCDDDFNREGRCVFYPAWSRLPSLHPIVWTLMGALHAVELGGCLITRLMPGGRILPHADESWHANWFNRKCYVALKSNPWAVNTCGDEAVNFRDGEIWEFVNTVRHDVHNGGPDERIAAILSFRSEDGLVSQKPAG